MDKNERSQYIKVVHHIPGRMRIDLPGMLNGENLRRQLVQLEKVPGFIALRPNAKTGRILVIYDHRLLNRQSALGYIAVFADPAPVAAAGCGTAKGEFGGHKGLTDQEAASRLAEYGPNSLPEARMPGSLRLFTRQFDNFLAKTLLASSVVCVFARELSNAASILAIASVNAAFSAYQERNAGKALEALNRLVDPRARVLRDGVVKSIPAAELVPGDLVFLEQGNSVPADLTLIEARHLSVEESSLTGESSPVVKTPAMPNEKSNAAVYMGTAVCRGKGSGIVTATGMDTGIGKISSTIKEDRIVRTPLQRELSGIGKVFVRVSATAGLITLLTGLSRGNHLFPALVSALSLAVTAIPEGLPTMVNIAHANGVRRLARQKTIVRKLSSIEHISVTTIICTDKTGTLTKNEQTVKHIYAGQRLWSFEGEGYDPSKGGVIPGGTGNVNSHSDLISALRCGALCNDARLDGCCRVEGDPLEGALLAAAGRAGLDIHSLRSEFTRLGEIPFTAERSRMAVFCRNNEGQACAYVKGSPEKVIDLCGKMMCCSETKAITDKDKAGMLRQRDAFAGRGYRVLALAQKLLSSPEHEEGAESDLTFLGLAAFSDPPRPEAKEAVQWFKRAGIKTAIITGDHGVTAAALAEELGISGHRSYLTGADIERMDPEELRLRIKDTFIFSGMLPAQKIKVIKALQQNNETVTMIGDGVNDAPAVKLADIGIAMGGIGADVTKQSADIVITNDSFAAVSGALIQGRALHRNIKRTVKYLLATNVGELIISFVPAIINRRMTLIPIQMFWLNLLVDSLPALALGIRPPSSNEMDMSFESKKVVDKKVFNTALCRGINTGLSGLAAFALGMGSGDISRAQTLSLANVTLRQIIYALECGDKKPDKSLKIALALTASLFLGSVYIPFLRKILKTHPLSVSDWLLASSTAFAASILDAFCEYIKRAGGKPTPLKLRMPPAASGLTKKECLPIFETPGQ